MANFGLMQLCLIAYTLIKDMNYYCAKFYTNKSTNMDSTNIFQFLAIFAQMMMMMMMNWLFNVTINDISVIYVTAHRCAGGLKKKLDLRSGSHAIDIS